MDAYEFSFVAVPAQRDAGVLKGMGSRSLKDLAERFGAQREYRELYKQAQLGAAFEKQLRDKVVRLCLMLDLGVEEPVLRGVLGKATAEELGAMEKALEARTAECFPMQTQLPGGNVPQTEMESGFLI